MRHYRWGRFAATIAIGYALTCVAFGAYTLIAGPDDTDNPGFSVLRKVTGLGFGPFGSHSAWWETLAGLAVCLLLAYVLWVGLRGRMAGPKPALDRSARWLRVVLLVEAVLKLAWTAPLISISFAIPLGDRSIYVAESIVQVVGVVLWFRVLRGPKGLRLATLAAGLAAAAAVAAADLASLLGAERSGELLGLWAPAWVPYIIWIGLTLVAQSRDGRWRPATVGLGAAGLAVQYLSGPLYLAENTSFLELNGAIGTVGTLLQAAWLLRSAHELASPEIGPARARWPLMGQGTPWPAGLAAVAAAAVPSVIAVRQGLPSWMGVSLKTVDTGSVLPTGVDLAIAAGGLSVLTLAAVVTRRAGLLRMTVLLLVVAASLGLVWLIPDTRSSMIFMSEVDAWGNALRDAPLFSYSGGRSELPAYWFSAGFAAAAGLLFLAYSGRTRLPAVVAVAAATVATLVLPAADQAQGKITTAEDCTPLSGTPQLTASEEFVCRERQTKVFDPAGNLSDADLVAYGRQLCGVFTRDDPGETARVRTASGYSVRQISSGLDAICPAAAKVTAARQARDAQEMAEWEAADQRRCDTAPRHRPRVKPLDRVRVREPFLTDYGDFEAYGDGFDGPEEPYDYSDDFVSVTHDYAVIHTYSDWSLCLTGDIYSRRPPVETAGWSKVVEIGFSATGTSIDFVDPMYADSPGISLPVRTPGHYRIRIHYQVIRLKGDDWAAQQLHFMVFPGTSDRVKVLK